MLGREEEVDPRLEGEDERLGVREEEGDGLGVKKGKKETCCCYHKKRPSGVNSG